MFHLLATEAVEQLQKKGNRASRVEL